MIPQLPPIVPEGVTLIAPADYTVEQFDADIIDIIVRNPDNVNPYTVNPGTSSGIKCLYFNDGKRCLLGTWIHERGHYYEPHWDHAGGGIAVGEILRLLDYDTNVQIRAACLQSKADGGGTGPVAWRILLHLPN